MAYRIFSIPILNYEIKVQVKTNLEMAIHHHKPSTALAKARQIRGYRSHLDLKAPQTKVEEKQK